MIACWSDIHEPLDSKDHARSRDVSHSLDQRHSEEWGLDYWLVSTNSSSPFVPYPCPPAPAGTRSLPTALGGGWRGSCQSLGRQATERTFPGHTCVQGRCGRQPTWPEFHPSELRYWAFLPSSPSHPHGRTLGPSLWMSPYRLNLGSQCFLGRPWGGSGGFLKTVFTFVSYHSIL